MFGELEKLRHRPRPFEFYTAQELWNDAYVSGKMLESHLDDAADRASRRGSFVRRSIEWIAARFNIGAETRICDFGCGPGLYSSPFAEMGADVTGIDFSERSIRHARETAQQKQLAVEYILQNYLEFSPRKKFHLLTMIFVDFCVLSPVQRKRLLEVFEACLEKDGKILLDALSLNYFNQVSEESTYEYSAADGFWTAEPYYAFVDTFKYEDEKVVLDRHTIFEETRTREVYNWLQCYSLESLGQELDENGFRILEHYSDVAGTPFDTQSTEFAVVLERK